MSSQTATNTVDNAKKNTTNIANTTTSTTSTVANTTTSTGSSITDFFNNVFNKTNIILIIWFLGIYFIAYFGLGFFFNKGGDITNFQLKLSRILDIIFLVTLLILLFSFYFNNTPQQQQDSASNALTSISTFLDNPVSFFTTAFFLFIFYAATYLFRIPMTPDTKPIFISFIENVAWLVFVIIIIINFFAYILGISLTDLFNNFWDSLNNNPVYDSSNNKVKNVVDNSNNKVKNVVDSSNNTVKTTVDSSNNTVPAPPKKDEVFNVSNNLYTYDDAQAICKAYGATIATYDQIEDSYNNGGEWCNYGWSDNQSIYFPTQKSTWDYLQTTDKHKNDCGRPGVNGGYIANPYVKFGVNCYGKKPAETAEDLARLNSKQNTIYPKTPEDLALDSKVQYWKDNAAQLLQLNSFNTKAWSEY